MSKKKPELKKKKREHLDTIRRRPCMDCESVGGNITFDHCRGKKIYNVGSMVWNSSSFGKLLREIDKCDPVCRSCHDIREFRRGRFHINSIKRNIYKLAELLRQELEMKTTIELTAKEVAEILIQKFNLPADTEVTYNINQRRDYWDRGDGSYQMDSVRLG